ncbi:hypothetical protein MSG28_011970 [Choristoneura fumiferana]|uniref:Uncharacterized protein n=1 Tax=Choristoneura fumiferana TaxID=7141 RepID=A0ACC0KNL4_CHOFU|nr:hypothetical protein MSG28_011970 [Choristoneura fumiferana]
MQHISIGAYQQSIFAADILVVVGIRRLFDFREFRFDFGSPALPVPASPAFLHPPPPLAGPPPPPAPSRRRYGPAYAPLWVPVYRGQQTRAIMY